MTQVPELKLFRAVLTQAIQDSMYDGLDKYAIIQKREAISWLTSNSTDFKYICFYADINPDYALNKFAKAMKLDIYKLTETQDRIIQNRPKRPHKEIKNYRLSFND